MSLLRLLTTGKSLVGLKDQQSRYVSRGGLPRFGGKRNPFRATTRPEFGPQSEANRPASADLTKSAEEESTEPSPGLISAALLVKPAMPFVPVETQPAATPLPATPLQAPCQAPLGARVSRKSLFFDWRRLIFWKSARPQSGAIPRFSKPLVQGELSLDGVKVVCNDLSEADLEIVPAQPAVAPTEAPPANPLNKELAAETTWSRVSGRFFGAGKL